MVQSSLIISQITLIGLSPAILHTSTPASVWPGRIKSLGVVLSPHTSAMVNLAQIQKPPFLLVWHKWSMRAVV